MTLMVAAPSCSSNGSDDDDPNGKPPVVIPEGLHESLKGSDYYLIQVDGETTGQLEGRITQNYYINNETRNLYIWAEGNLTYAAGASEGPNAYGVPGAYISFVVLPEKGWSGGGFHYDNVDFSGITRDYYFHIALKSPTNQPEIGHTFTFWSQGATVYLYFGPDATNNDYVANYAHDGEWHHFDVPMSKFLDVGYLWTGPANAIIGFASGGIGGTELNMDAIFFYKKAN
jgi:hypothetical protein